MRDFTIWIEWYFPCKCNTINFPWCYYKVCWHFLWSWKIAIVIFIFYLNAQNEWTIHLYCCPVEVSQSQIKLPNIVCWYFCWSNWRTWLPDYSKFLNISAKQLTTFSYRQMCNWCITCLISQWTTLFFLWLVLSMSNRISVLIALQLFVLIIAETIFWCRNLSEINSSCFWC